MVSVKDGYYCSLTGKHKQPAIDWLRQEGHDAVISRDFTAQFGRGEDQQADRLAKLLRQRKVAFKEAENVNTGTFKAIIKEMVEGGRRVPLVKLGVRVVPTSTIKVKV